MKKERKKEGCNPPRNIDRLAQTHTQQQLFTIAMTVASRQRLKTGVRIFEKNQRFLTFSPAPFNGTLSKIIHGIPIFILQGPS